MRSPQRIYLYTITWAALVLLLTALVRLTGLLVAAWFGFPAAREAVALWAGLAVAALPVFVGHALWLERQLRSSQEERASEGLQLYVHAAALACLVYLARGGLEVVHRPLELALGVGEDLSPVWWTNWLSSWAYVAWAAVFLGYTVRLGKEAAKPTGRAGRWRRLFLLGVGEGGVVLSLVGLSGLLATLFMRPLLAVPPGQLTKGQWWSEPLAGYTATAWLGLALWAWAWFRFGDESHTAPRALARQAFFYLNIALGLAVGLVAMAYLVRWGLLRVFGQPLGPRYTWWPPMARALAALLPAWGMWWVHRRRAWREFGFPETSWYHLAVGRLYTYVACAVGLAVSWWGATTVLRTALMQALQLQPDALTFPPGWWRVPLATGMAALVVAVPFWAWRWRRVQEVATRAEAFAVQERGSRLRRAYLYGVALVGGLVSLVSWGRVAYAVWLWVLAVEGATVKVELANSGGAGLVAVLAWAYHLLVLRHGARGPVLDREARRRQLLAEREALERRLAELEAELQTLESPD